MRRHVAGRGGIEPGERGSVNSVFSLSRYIAIIVKQAQAAVTNPAAGNVAPRSRVTGSARIALGFRDFPCGRAHCDRALRVYAGAIPRPTPTVPKG
jgi:hypothetical protein